MREVVPATTVVALQRALATGVVDDTFDEAAAALARALGATGAWIGRRVNGRFECAGASVHGTPVRLVTIGLDQLPVLARREPTLARLSDIERAALFGAYAPEQSAWGLPLVSQDAVVGAIAVLVPATLDPDAMLLLAEVGADAGLAVQSMSTQRELRAGLREHQALLDALDMMIVVTDSGGGVRTVNRALRQRLGTPPGNLVGRSVDTLFVGQRLPSVGDHPRTTLTGPQGEPLRAAAYPLRDGGAVVVVQDARGASAPRMPAVVAPALAMPALRRNPTPRVARARVLVLDDEPSILRAISRTLSPYHDILTAPDGLAGVALLEAEGEVAVVVTDVQMPRLGGLDFYRWIEQNRPTLAPRVLFVTGGVFDPETERFLRAMGPRVLRKPFDPEALRRAVDERASV